MEVKTSRNEQQFRMSEALYFGLMQYLSKNKMTIDDFLKKINLYKARYMMRKIIDRKIQMHTYISILERIARACDMIDKVEVGTPY